MATARTVRDDRSAATRAARPPAASRATKTGTQYWRVFGSSKRRAWPRRPLPSSGTSWVSVASPKPAARAAHRTSERPAGAVLMVTARLPEDGLYYALLAEPGRLEASGIRTVTRVGDCFAPSTIAAAVQSGHRFARELDEHPALDLSFRVEHIRHEA